MYEYFDLDYKNTIFEWDDEKAVSNFKKHGIRFETASKDHPKEDRYDILGKVGKVLFVVCTFKKGNIIHIISARRATEPEKVRYEYGESYDA